MAQADTQQPQVSRYVGLSAEWPLPPFCIQNQVASLSSLHSGRFYLPELNGTAGILQKKNRPVIIFIKFHSQLLLLVHIPNNQ